MKQSAVAILGALSVRPGSGYDIRKDIEISLSNFWKESFGQIYPRLKSLKEEGLIRELEDQGATGRQKRIYAITDEGRAALQGWLAEPVVPQVMRNELLLKVFFGAEAGSEVIRDHLQQTLDAAQTRLTELRQIEEMLGQVNFGPDKVQYWKMTADYGVAMYEAQVKWCQSSLQMIEEQKKTEMEKS